MIERSTYRPSEVAVMLGVSKSTIHNWIKDGLLPAVKVGHVVRIPRAWYEEWLNTRRAA